MRSLALTDRWCLMQALAPRWTLHANVAVQPPKPFRSLDCASVSRTPKGSKPRKQNFAPPKQHWPTPKKRMQPRCLPLGWIVRLGLRKRWALLEDFRVQSRSRSHLNRRFALAPWCRMPTRMKPVVVLLLALPLCLRVLRLLHVPLCLRLLLFGQHQCPRRSRQRLVRLLVARPLPPLQLWTRCR